MVYSSVSLRGKLIQTWDAMTLTQETAMEIYGEMWEVPPRQHMLPITVTYMQTISRSMERLLEIRRSSRRNYLRMLTLKRYRITVTSLFAVRRQPQFSKSEPPSYELFGRPMKASDLVSQPALVQTSVEGGATLLTQSAQLYLETCLASLGNVFCVAPSFRVENSFTRGHLSEYTHIEAELDFITFDELLQHLEEVMCRVIETILADPTIAGSIKNLNSDFKAPQRPFLRMKYAEAIEWLARHEIPNEDGEPHKFGDDITGKSQCYCPRSIVEKFFTNWE
jgi:asparaginyl-tRNA synthetase